MSASPTPRLSGATIQPTSAAADSADAESVKPVECLGEPALATALQKSVGEARHDPASDQHDQGDQHGEREAAAMGGVAAQVRLDMKKDIGGEQQRDDDQHPEITHVLASEDLARHGRTEQRQKRAIDHRRERPAYMARQGHRDRPASQTENSASKGRPRNGRRPVQFGAAVSRNPATTAPP